MVVAKGDDDLERSGDEYLFIAAAYLPALKSLAIQGPCGSLPLDLRAFRSATPTSRPLPIQTWALTNLSLVQVFMLGPECRYIFESFSQLKTLTIRAFQASPAFAEHLYLLPSTLKHLDITIECPSQSFQDPSRLVPLPKLDALGTHFPNLAELYLAGEIFTSKLLKDLHHAEKLELLCFGHNAPVRAVDLLALLKRSSPYKIHSLQHLDLHICQIERAGSRKRTPAWTEGLTKKGVRKVVKACEEAGVELDGTVKCALKTCDWAEKGEQCMRG